MAHSKLDPIKIEATNGNIYEGFLVAKQPKTATLYACIYDKDFNAYSVYHTYSKKHGTKVHIRKCRQYGN
jgi:hypothetical protein